MKCTNKERETCEVEKLKNIINDMAEQLTTPIHSKEWVINHFTNKYEEEK